MEPSNIYQGLRASRLPLATLLAPLRGAAQTSFQPELARGIQEAVKERQRYVESFKNLTAVETKTTEIIDKAGKVEDRRTVISDFLVYASPLRAGVVSEYRITREVDGKAYGKGEKQAAELFEKLAKAKTLEQEGNRLRDENMKHTLKYYRWGVTLQPAPQIQSTATYEFEIVGRDKVNGRDTIILKYKRKLLMTDEFKGLTRNFNNPKTGNRGQLWLDAETFHIWRWVNENTVTDRDIPAEAVFGRDEIEYAPSAFGVNVPVRIVTSYFDKKDASKGSVRLAGRITFTYATFKRFGVTTVYRLESPK
jgi:hypothetical protein